jgi:Glycosyltransferase family 87
MGLQNHIEHQQHWQVSVAKSGLVVWSLTMLWLCWWSGIQHDYTWYLVQWRNLLEGNDPWGSGNAYGPLYTAIGFLLPLGPLAPKFLMVGALLAANAVLVFELLHERSMRPIQIIYLLAIPTNVLVVGAGVIYGLNDAFVAGLLVTAALLRRRGRFLACGVFVGFAALTKYYPLLLLPLFALDEGKLRWSVIAGGVIIFFSGFIVALAIWGVDPLKAIYRGSIRGPTLLSAIKALHDVFGDEGAVGWLIRYNSCLVVSGVMAALLFSWKARLNWLEGVVIGYLVMLTLYKVGHTQFYLPWLFMVASLPLVGKQSADRTAIILLPVVLLLSLYQIDYQFSSDRELYWPERYLGFIAFLVSTASIAVCAVDLWMHRHGSGDLSSTILGGSSKRNRPTAR